MHRIGRTGRAGATGTAYTFFTADNAKQARHLVKILEEAKQEVNPQLREMAGYGILIFTNLQEDMEDPHMEAGEVAVEEADSVVETTEDFLAVAMTHTEDANYIFSETSFVIHGINNHFYPNFILHCASSTSTIKEHMIWTLPIIALGTSLLITLLYKTFKTNNSIYPIILILLNTLITYPVGLQFTIITNPPYIL